MTTATAVLALSLLAPPGAVGDRGFVPPALAPWIPWVLHGHEAARCPGLQAAQDDESQCLWPTRLTLEVKEKGASFGQQWTVFDPRGAWVTLPGNAEAWPQGVKVDGKPAVVTGQEAGPAVWVGPGTHAVAGAFVWDAPPESLQIPKATGLLALSLRGAPVALPAWDGDGKLWLQRKAPRAAEEDRLEVTVERRLDDEVPALVSTRLLLSVSGKAREATIGPVLLPGLEPLSIDSELPVRLEPDGRLRIRLRPGDFTVTLVARSTAPLLALAEPRIQGPRANEAIWAFAAHDDIRQVQVSGVPAVDPQQTRLPDDWKSLPAYRLAPGDTMKLVQVRRGDPTPAPDALSLVRTLWLDFDGGGYTVHDQVSGQMHRGWRLETGPRLALGRVAVGGADQFITRLAPGGPLGVEVRQGALDLAADARIEGAVGELPAVGWRHDFRSVRTVLNLPPGWRLLHASGVDDAGPTWVKSWTLLDLFAVLVTAFAIWKLWGLGWGALALFALALSYHEAGAARWLWLVVVGFAALARVLPEGRLRSLAWVGRLAAGAWLAVTLLVFGVQQLRQAMYPALENPGAGEGAGNGYLDLAAGGVNALAGAEMAPLAAPAASKKGLRAFRQEDRTRATKAGMLGALGGADGAASNIFGPAGLGAGVNNALGSMGSASQTATFAQVVDPNAAIQTGPGLTSWRWRTVGLAFSGPVAAGQRIHLWLVPPGLERLLDLVRVALCALLALVLLGVPGLPPPRIGRAAGAAGAAVVFALLALAPAARAQEVPRQDVLDALRDRLLEKPTCTPTCASIARLDLTANAGALRLDLDVGAAAETAVPLPGDAQQWRPTEVTLDGRPAPALWRSDGALWIELPSGLHRVTASGPLPARPSVQIALPMKPHAAEIHATGWTVQGVHEDGQVDDDLQLTRVAGEAAQTGEAAALPPSDLPPFARVRRTLRLGLLWNVHTEVERAAAGGPAMVLSVPLLPGESPTSAGLHVAKGHVEVNLGPDRDSAAWDSVLAQRSPIRLAAPRDVPWTEDWRLDVSPIWHAEESGIPPVHRQDAEGDRLPEWLPWPGETVAIDVTRPAGVPGPTLTVDASTLALDPGLRSTDATLTARLRSSRGGPHVVRLPEGAELRQLVLNGRSAPVRQAGRDVTLDLNPGTTDVALSFTEARGIGTFWRAPAVDLGAPSVNARTNVDLPRDRWVLFVGGPRLGPAVLFWGVLAALLLAAVALGRLGLAPLGTGRWFVLGLGFTQAPIWAGVVFAGWLLVLGLRRRSPI